MILNEDEIMRCPKCGGTSFSVTAHVTQDWEVGEDGQFVACICDCVEVTHEPDAEDVWFCRKCGFDAAGSEFITTVPQDGLEPEYTEPPQLEGSLAYMGLEIDPQLLYSREQVLSILEDGGGAFTALEGVRDQYAERFGNELYWNYPFCDGLHNGGILLPVAEGFLWLPYDSVDAETYEQFVMEGVSLLTAEEADAMIKELRAYTEGICGALADISRALS